MNWKKVLRTNVTKAGELREYMGLTDSQIEHLNRILHQLPMIVTRYYLSLTDWNDPACDPVFRICTPSVSETGLSGDFDTSREADNTVTSGLQHRYSQTALIPSTHRCAMYYRHCFRKRLVGISDDETADNVAEMAAYVNTHNGISNILISGRDAFVNSNQVIAQYLEHLIPIPHLNLVHFDIHIPAVFPERIYDSHELLDILKTYTQKKQIYAVTQFSHPEGLTDHVRKVAKTPLDVGVIIKNQAVLLKGINDSSHVLDALLKDLTKRGAVPYYIFQCRPISGIRSQFQVPLTQDYEVVEGAKNMQNGQGKYIHYVMSHIAGKIEMLRPASQNEMLFKYHQTKYVKDYDRIFTGEMTPGRAWLGEPAGQESQNRAAAAGTKPLAPVLIPGSTGKLLRQ